MPDQATFNTKAWSSESVALVGARQGGRIPKPYVHFSSLRSCSHKGAWQLLLLPPWSRRRESRFHGRRESSCLYGAGAFSMEPWSLPASRRRESRGVLGLPQNPKQTRRLNQSAVAYLCLARIGFRPDAGMGQSRGPLLASARIGLNLKPEAEARVKS